MGKILIFDRSRFLALDRRSIKDWVFPISNPQRSRNTIQFVDLLEHNQNQIILPFLTLWYCFDFSCTLQTCYPFSHESGNFPPFSPSPYSSAYSQLKTSSSPTPLSSSLASCSTDLLLSCLSLLRSNQSHNLGHPRTTFMPLVLCLLHLLDIHILFIEAIWLFRDGRQWPFHTHKWYPLIHQCRQDFLLILDLHKMKYAEYFLTIE